MRSEREVRKELKRVNAARALEGSDTERGEDLDCMARALKWVLRKTKVMSPMEWVDWEREEAEDTAGQEGGGVLVA